MLHRGRLKILVAAVLFLTYGIAPSALSVSAVEAEAPAGVRPPEIRGTLTLNGCVLEASQIQLQAEPMRIGGPGVAPSAPDQTITERSAKLEPTDNPHRFTFTVLGVRPATLYRLGIYTPPESCGKVTWEGPQFGLAVGGGLPIEIEGFAVRTQIEVRESGRERWVGADDLEFTAPDRSVRTFRWRSDLAGLVGGELQISTERFAVGKGSRACDEPGDGIVYRQRIRAGSGEWVEADPIDFGQILSAQPPVSDLALSGIERTALGEETLNLLLGGAPLYLRVIPISSAGPVCDSTTAGAHGWVILARLPRIEEVPEQPAAPAGFAESSEGGSLAAEAVEPILEAGNGQSYTPPFIGGADFGHPTYGELGFKIIKPHKLPTSEMCVFFINDQLGCELLKLGYEPGATVLPHPDHWFFFAPQSSGGGGNNLITGTFGAALGAVSGLITSVGSAVTFIAELYEAIKAEVVKVVVEALKFAGLGAVCDDIAGVGGESSCQDLVAAALTTGLAAVGLPPSLPNWEQLKQQGADYLAAEIATRTYLPEKVTAEAVKIAQKAVEDMTTNRGGSDPNYNWVVPYLGFEPAVWSLMVRKNNPEPIPYFLNIANATSHLYRGGVARLAFLSGSQEQRIPFVLYPNLDNIPAPRCTFDRRNPPAKCEPDPTLSEPECFGKSYEAGKPDEWMRLPCSWSNYTEIYYRDAWISQKLWPGTSCFGLLGRTRLSVPLLGWVDPPPELRFLSLARKHPLIPDTWDGAFFSGQGCPIFPVFSVTGDLSAN